jgi:epoxyqueuosine reductase
MTLENEIRDATIDIRAKALALGFHAVGIASAQSDPEQEAALRQFLKLGRHGDMDWMTAKADRRVSPTALWPEARFVVALGINYGPSVDPLAIHGRPDRGAISVYAQGRDYHDVVKKRLKELARWMVETHGGDVKVFVDTAPVMEKPLAARAGLGWQGKHTNLVSRTFGSWLFLGEVFTTLNLTPDTPEVDHCGSCDLCQKACPTGALDEAYRIDATRCISYLTIETKAGIDEDLMAQMGNHIYGCDDCLAVCPWNKFENATDESAFNPRPELSAPRLGDILDLDDAGFRQVYAGSPIKRSGRDRVVRNALIAAGNSGLASLAPAVAALLTDSSDLVQQAAKWAHERLISLDKA